MSKKGHQLFWRIKKIPGPLSSFIVIRALSTDALIELTLLSFLKAAESDSMVNKPTSPAVPPVELVDLLALNLS